MYSLGVEKVLSFTGLATHANQLSHVAVTRDRGKTFRDRPHIQADQARGEATELFLEVSASSLQLSSSERVVVCV